MTRIAIVGYGGMGRVHHESYRKVNDAAVTAVCDVSVDFDSINSNKPEINIATNASESTTDETLSYYRDLDSLLSAGGFDAVDICLPTFLHAEFSVRCLDTGFPVMCEKPMSLDLESAGEMTAAANSSGKVLSIAHCLRFWPAYLEIKRLIDSAKYGRVTYASLSRYSAPPAWSWNDWMKREVTSGGALLDLHIHDTDMVLFLFGTPASVVSTGNESDEIGIYHVDTLYRYPDKVVHGSGGWAASSSYGFRMMATVAFEGATLALDNTKPEFLTVFPDGEEAFVPELSDLDGYYYEAAGFARAAATGDRSGTVTPESAAETIRVCLAEAQSVREKREIPV